MQIIKRNIKGGRLVGEKLEKSIDAYTLLEVYQQMIAPKLKEIDVFLKTKESDITVSEAAGLLDESEKNILNIMARLHLTKIDKKSFIKIMINGRSPICGLLRRELDCGSPILYSRKDIAYIYNLDLNKVNEVCDKLHIKEITSYTMPKVFAHIPY